jgi:hypothetical protein
MQTDSITINVSAKAAEAYRKASPCVQRHIQEFLEFSLIDDEEPDSGVFSDATKELDQALDDIGQNARRRGLTDDKLGAILNGPQA